VYPNMHIYMCACAPRFTYMIHFFCICENRSGLCMRAPLCDGDGSAVCERVGGLVLRARPEPETLNRASPCPSGVDRVRLRRAGVLVGVGVQREHRRVEHRACHHVAPGMRRLFGPGGAHYGGRARPGFDAARPVVRGGFGAQAFSSASAFNANIGAWNTALVTTLGTVCAASSRHRSGCAWSVFDAPLCSAPPAMRTRA
jgi:hypothetical protein